MRLALVGLLAAGGLALTIILGWSWSASVPVAAADPQQWQRRELMFLKATYDRVQADLSRQPQPSASLQAENDRILRLMTETAKLMPAEAVPAEISELLAAAEPPAAAQETLTQLIESVATETEETLDLRVGLVSSAPAGIDVSAFAIDPELREPIPRRTVRAKGRAEAAEKSKEASAR